MNEKEKEKEAGLLEEYVWRKKSGWVLTVQLEEENGFLVNATKLLCPFASTCSNDPA